MKTSLGELAHHLCCELRGDAQTIVEGVEDPRRAGPRDVAAILTKAGVRSLAECNAGALLVGAPIEDPRPQLVAADPRAALGRILDHFHPEPDVRSGVDASAMVAASAHIAATASIGPFCLVEEEAVVEERACLDPYVYVGAGVSIGAGARIGVRATLCAGVRVGAGARVAPGAVIGDGGFGLWREGERLRRIRSVGGVELGEGAQVGANSCVDGGTLAPTRIGAGAQIDNLVQIGHNVRLGANVIVCAQSGVAGSAQIGASSELGGQVGVADHVAVGEGARIGAKSGVGGDVPAGATYSGYPAIPHAQWLRSSAIFGRLGSLWRKVRRLDG